MKGCLHFLPLSLSSLYWLPNRFRQYRLNSQLDTQSSRSLRVIHTGTCISSLKLLMQNGTIQAIVNGTDMYGKDLMFTKSLRGKSIYSCWRDKREILFLSDKISQRRKPCTPDIGIDLLLCSDPDIYLLANCNRQGPFSTERIRLSEEQCIFFHAFWTDATPSI